MKKIKTLTIQESKELLEHVFPNQTPLGNPKNYQYWVEGINFSPTGIITFSGNNDVGIKYRGGLNNDGFVLPLNNTKVVYWLYKHGYDVEKYLEENQYMSEQENDFADLIYHMENTLEKGLSEYIKTKIKSIINRFYERQ